MNDSLGEYLKKERESRRVTVEGISRATRIGKDLILALENDRLESFSQPEYICGYLKLYSTHLGLDQKVVLDIAALQFQDLHKKRPHSRTPAFLAFNSPLSYVAEAKDASSRRSDRIIRRGIMTGFAVLLVSLFFYIPSEYGTQESLRRDTTTGAPTVHGGTSTQEAGSAEAGALNVPSSGGAVPSHAGSTQAEVAKPETAVKVIANRDSKRYHLPGMKYYDQVLAYHRVTFDSEEEAVKAGYTKAPR